MKTAKIVIGILSIVLFLVVSLQSCAAGLANTMVGNGEISGTAGFMVALMLLSAGIVGIAGRKHKGAAIACSILYSIGAILGFANAGSYKDLYIWSGLSVALALFFFISIFVQKYGTNMPQKQA